MARQDIIKMRVKELKRLKVLQQAIDKHITQKTAATIIGVTERQIRRIIRAVRDEGDKGIIHKLRGSASNRKVPERVKKKVLLLYQRKYIGFGPTLACEKLMEIDNIRISVESLRKWLIDRGLWKRRRKGSKHRQWRERKECFGQMLQMDGSHHDWLEGRGPQLVLMGYIDDATSKIFARFYDYEGTIPALDSFRRYIKRHGIPHSVYLDRHTTYKSNKRLTEEEEIEGQVEAKSQFERALLELGVEVIHANSPQAKGRVERMFGVLQDRLIKEMRLRGIKTKQGANIFLQRYLPIHNRRFGRVAANSANVHMRVPPYYDIDSILCIKSPRSVRNDSTISYQGRLYRIEDPVKTNKVIVQERLDRSMHITGDGKSLTYREITERPKKACEVAKRLKKPKTPYTPSKYHPWKRQQYLGYIQKQKEISVSNS